MRLFFSQRRSKVVALSGVGPGLVRVVGRTPYNQMKNISTRAVSDEFDGHSICLK